MWGFVATSEYRLAAAVEAQDDKASAIIVHARVAPELINVVEEQIDPQQDQRQVA